MRFESPAWLALLALIPLLAIVFAAGERRGVHNLKRFAAARLLPTLGSSAKWPRILRLTLIMITIALLSASLARPSYGYHLREIHGKGADIIFAVDVSRSMLCTDISPNRLTRAKLAAKDMLELARGHRIGVIPFSREAFLQCPMTLDEAAVSQSIDALDITSTPRQGTSIGDTIAEARKAFASSGNNKRILVIFTDGEDLEGEGLSEARGTKDMTIIAIGTGTVQGAPVPISEDAGSGYIRDDSGNPVTSRLDSATLESVASATGGFYVPVNAPSMDARFKDALSKDDTESNAQTANLRLPIIRYRWPLAAALVLLFAESFIPAFKRKGGAALIALAMLMPAAPNQGNAAEPTSQTPAQTAPATPQKKPAVPAHNPRVDYNKGVALFDKGSYTEATNAFEKAIKDSAASPVELRKQLYGNAGASKLAHALSTIPAGEEPMAPEADKAARELLNKAKADLEKALSLAPEDAILQKNFKLVNDAFDELEKHKPKPQNKNQPQKKPEDQKDHKKDDPLPTPEHKEEPPPPKKDDEDNNNDKGDKKQQGGGGQSKDSKESNSGGNSDKNSQQQNGQGGQSDSSGSSSQDQQPSQGNQQNQPQSNKDQQQKQNQSQQPQQGQQGQQSGNQDQNQPQQGNQPQQNSADPKPQENQPKKDESKDKTKEQSDRDKNQQQQPQAQASSDKQNSGDNGRDKQQSQGEKQPEAQKPDVNQNDAGKEGDKQKAQAPEKKKDQGADADAAQKEGPQPQPQQQPKEEKQQGDKGQDENGQKEQSKPTPKPAPAPSPSPAATNGNEGKNEAPKPQAGNKGQQPAAAPQQSAAQESAAQKKKDSAGQSSSQDSAAAEQQKSAAAVSQAGGDQPAETQGAQATASADEPRREGDHTANLARPGEKSDDKKPVATTSATAVTDKDGVPTDGKMTPIQAEQLLKFLQDDEKLLPAGQVKNQRQNNISGRDW